MPVQHSLDLVPGNLAKGSLGLQRHFLRHGGNLGKRGLAAELAGQTAEPGVDNAQILRAEGILGPPALGAEELCLELSGKLHAKLPRHAAYARGKVQALRLPKQPDAGNVPLDQALAGVLDGRPDGLGPGHEQVEQEHPVPAHFLDFIERHRPSGELLHVVERALGKPGQVVSGRTGEGGRGLARLGLREHPLAEDHVHMGPLRTGCLAVLPVLACAEVSAAVEGRKQLVPPRSTDQHVGGRTDREQALFNGLPELRIRHEALQLFQDFLRIPVAKACFPAHGLELGIGLDQAAVPVLFPAAAGTGVVGVEKRRCSSP